MKNDTTSASISDDYILHLFHLQKEQIDSFHVNHQDDGVHVRIKLTPKTTSCPVCGFPTSKVKSYVHKRITHSMLNTEACYIDYQARRYICPACNKTFYEDNPFTFKGMKISLLTVYNVLRDLKNPADTFKSVAQRNHISSTSAMSIFDRHVQISRRKLPEYLNIDEVYSFKSENSSYVCVLLDFNSQNVIDLLPGRKKSELINYFSFIPREERCAVKAVSIDLWETYRIVAKMMFPNAAIAADKFHLIQELNRRVDKVRLRTMNQLKNYKLMDLKNADAASIEKAERMRKQYYLYKKFNWLLFTNDPAYTDPNREKKYNKVLQGYYNYNDILHYMCLYNPELEEAMNLKDRMIYFYKNSDLDNARKDINELISAFRDCKVPEISSFANTMTRWKTEIINSFIVTNEHGRKINSGIIENRNRTIKCIKHNSNGYTNWKRFRNRVLYVLNKDTTYHLYPKEGENENEQ